MDKSADTRSQNGKSAQDSTVIASVYQVVASRRLGYDTSMWQVPALSFTAQAFLFTIALSASSNVARLIAASLALVIALISLQLMAKHRYHETIDARLLEAFEADMNLKGFFHCLPHERPVYRAEQVGVKSQWFQHLSSYRVWMSGLAVFAIASIGIIIFIFINPMLLK